MKATKIKIFNHGDKVKILKTKQTGTIFIRNGRWVIINLDNGEKWKGETDQIKHFETL